MVKKKKFLFKKQGKFVDIGRVDTDVLDMLPRKVSKQFFGGYDEIQAKDIDRALAKVTKGRKVTTVATGKVVRIEDMM